MTNKRKVAPDISVLRLTAEKVSRQLKENQIAHLLIGGLAVAEYGYPRATADVDFIVTPEGLAKLTGTPNAIGLSKDIGGVRVDFILPDVGEDVVEEEIEAPSPEEAVACPPIASIGLLIYLKLRANRRKDQADIVELVKRGAVPVQSVRRYLMENFDDTDLAADFDMLVRVAESEAD